MGNRNTRDAIEYSTTDARPKSQAESPVYRCARAHRIDEAALASATLYSIFHRTVSLFPTRPFLGTRDSLDNGNFGRYSWDTYAGVCEKVCRLADSILELVDFKRGSTTTFGIYSKTRAEWVVVDLACVSQSIASVILFDTLGYDCIAEVIKATRMRAMALSSINKSVIYHLKREGAIPSLTHLVQFEPVVLSERIEAQKLGFLLHSYSDLIHKSSGTGEKHPPGPETTYSICYTSGTYNAPIGVIVKHRQMASMAASVTDSFDFTEEDVYFSYLPQAHIMERSMTYIAMSVGEAIGFYAGNIFRIRNDMMELRPTVFSVVPRLVYKLNEGIRKDLLTYSKFKQSMFKRAMKSKQKEYRASGKLKNKIWDTVVLKKVRASFGGRVRILMVGGAPVNSDELEFLRLVLSVPIVEGYGLTESCAASLITSPDDREMGHVGGPLPLLEVKLINTSTNEAEEVVGELCLRGPQVSTDLYLPASGDQSTETSTLMDLDGWLHTGDIAKRLPHNGSFRIVDRLKSMFKLSHGEYIAPEKVEVCYKCPSIDFILVYGNPLKSHLVAVVVPNEVKLRAKFLKFHNIRADVPLDMLCASAEAKQYLLEKISALSARHHLNIYEQVKNIHLIPALDSSLFTTSGKLRRYTAIKFFERELEALYDEGAKAR